MLISLKNKIGGFEGLEQDKIIGTYLLLNQPSVGYVYIIRVFLLVMMATPLLIKIKDSRNIVFLLLFLCLFGLLELFVLFIPGLSTFTICGILYEQYFIYMLAYSLIFLLGLRLREIRGGDLIKVRIISLISFVLLMTLYIILNGLPIVFTPLYKYPPHAFYVAYGLAVCAFLWSFRDKLTWYCSKWTITSFIGQNTIWIYFWHILWLLIVPYFVNNWFVAYLCVFTLSVISYYFQYGIVRKINKSFFSKYFVG